MDLIKFNNYTPPAPSTYDIEFSDVNGEKASLEDGTTFIEQVRSDVPMIKVSWTNLTQDEVARITSELANDVITVQYFYGTMRTAQMTKNSRALKLKTIDSSGNTYWDLSCVLDG